MINKTSDKNVGSIKRLKQMVEIIPTCDFPKFQMDYDNALLFANDIENILAEREQKDERIKELEEENEILEFQNKQVKNYVEELKKYNKTVSDRIVAYKKDSISKQKIKDLLTEIQEEYNKLDKEIDKQIRDKNKDYYKCKENIAIMQTLAYCRDKFEELLEEK